MEIKLTQESSIGLGNYAKLSSEISSRLEEHFSNKNYGLGIKSIYINLICISPQAEAFFKVRKPKYKRGKEIIKANSTIFEVENSLRYDVKLNYEYVKEAAEQSIIIHIIEKLIESLSVLQSTRINDFDKKNFTDDFITLLKNQIEDAS